MSSMIFLKNVYLVAGHIIVDFNFVPDCSERRSSPQVQYLSSSGMINVDYMDIGHIIADLYVLLDFLLRLHSSTIVDYYPIRA